MAASDLHILVLYYSVGGSVRRMAEIARTLNPTIEIAVRTHDEEEADLLRKEGVGTVFFGEHELAVAMTRHALARHGVES